MNYLSPVEGHSTPAFSNVPKFISMLQPRGQGPLKIPTLRLYFGPLESEPLGVGGVQASAVLKTSQVIPVCRKLGYHQSVISLKYGPWISSNGLPGKLLERSLRPTPDLLGYNLIFTRMPRNP